MQETHIKKSEKIDFLATFKSFEVGECELLKFADTQAHATTFRTLYCKYRKQGLLTSKLRFTETKSPAGTFILRLA